MGSQSYSLIPIPHIDRMLQLKTLFLLSIGITLAKSGCPFEKLANIKKITKTNEVADPETTTPNDCTCNSLCGATVDDGFTLDWCTVEGECGEYSLAWGYWDYCLYKDSSKPDYVDLDWKIKHDMIWAEIKADPSFGAYHPTDLFTESVVTSFENEWDVMPAGRVKAIHGIGAVCPFTVDISPDSPFTGLLGPGQQITGLIRLGAGIDFMDPLSSGFLPGAAIKILRTGTSSANFVLFNELNPLPNQNHNLFAVPLKNHVSDQIYDLTTIAASKKFCQTGNCITKVGLSHVCTHDQDGNEVEEPVFPFMFLFDLTGEVNFREEKPASTEEFMDQFKNIQPGTRLYTMKGMRNPEDSEGFVLGDVVTTDNCLSSKFGDTKLFFKHQWIEDDVALKPEWTDAYFNECFCNRP